MPEGIVDVIPVDLVVAAIIAVAARGPPTTTARPTSSRSASGSANPLRYRRLVDLVQRLVHRAPAVRQRGPAHRRARVDVPRPRPGRRASSSGPRTLLDRAEKVARSRCRCGASRPSGRATLEEKRERGRAGPRLRRALRRLRRVRGDLRRRPPARAAATTLDAGRPAALRLRPPGHRLGPLRPRRSTCRRSSSTPGCAPTPGGRDRRDRARPPAPPGARPPTATSPPSTSRTRSSRRTSSRRTRGWPPAACPATTGSRFVAQDAAPRRRRCWRSTARDRGDFLRYFYRRYEGAPVDQLDDDAAEMFSDLHPHQVVPRRHPPGARAPARSATARVLITGALDFVVEPLAPAVRRHRRAPDCRSAPTARYTGELTDVPPTGEARAQALVDYADGRRPRPGRGGRLRRLGQRPADARGGRLPGGGQPRDPAGRHRPQAGLAGRALGEGRRARPRAARSPIAPLAPASRPAPSRREARR